MDKICDLVGDGARGQGGDDERGEREISCGVWKGPGRPAWQLRGDMQDCVLKLFALNVKLCLVYSRKGKTRARMANIYFIIVFIRVGGWSMKRHSRFLTAVRSGLSRLENGRLGLLCVSFAKLCYLIKVFSAPMKYTVCTVFSSFSCVAEGRGTQRDEGESSPCAHA